MQNKKNGIFYTIAFLFVLVLCQLAANELYDYTHPSFLSAAAAHRLMEIRLNAL